MAQTYTEDCFAAGHVGLTDLQNMENNFHALKTMFSGSSAPSNSTGGMPWFDTAKKILKIRGSTNGQWFGVLSASATPRFWLFANAAEDGWVVDSSVSDRVLAVKGGAQAFNVAGGSLAGNWTISGTTVGQESALHAHTFQHVHTVTTVTIYSGTSDMTPVEVIAASSAVNGSTFTGTESTVHTHSFSNDATWRPLAAVGTVQYLDL